MSTVHWLGAGLSSPSGIAHLAAQGVELCLWNRSVERARALVSKLGVDIPVHNYDLSKLAFALKPGDVVVSMLPAPMHVEVARACLERRAHLVTTSYISHEMRALHEVARERNVTLLNEAGLDPGLDHLAAHRLVLDLSSVCMADAQTRIDFVSACGGFPVNPGPFRYKFSWSPAGVLRALKNASRHIEDGKSVDHARPWDGLFSLSVQDETFEAYPNRDSTQYLAHYGLMGAWKMDRFMRATLRPDGWRKAWALLLNELPSLSDAALERRAHDLWQQHRYETDEEDRVVLVVSLVAQSGNEVCFAESLTLDVVGNASESAMSRLVSVPAAIGALSVLEGSTDFGVCGLPSRGAGLKHWFYALERAGIAFKRQRPVVPRA